MKDLASISPHTQICAVIGNPVAHSLSPAIHNAAIAELGLDFVYVAFRVEDVKNALAGMRALENFRGMSITIPHKIEAMKYVDEISPTDLNIGSINTVIHDRGRLTGMGTDGPGALKALRDSHVKIQGQKVLMLGSGGAARAIAFTLAENAMPAEISLLDVEGPLLGQLASDLKSKTDVTIRHEAMTDASLAEKINGADIIVHCTPVGMHPKVNASLVPPELFHRAQVVFDIVYTPLETKLLRDAKSRGLKVISGVEMFINQAVLQFERFTGEKAPIEVMRRVVMERLKT
jgi:shikimate dehydrogenase